MKAVLCCVVVVVIIGYDSPHALALWRNAYNTAAWDLTSCKCLSIE